MTKKSAAKREAKPEAQEQPEPEPTQQQSAAPNVVVGGLPRFNFNAPPTTQEVPVTDTTPRAKIFRPLRPNYESIQQEARGPGADKWRQVDKLRSELSELYRNLQEDERYAPEYKSETAWKRYEETKAKVEKLAPEAHREMLKSAEGLERQSIPVPGGEGLRTQDKDKLLITAHERSRLEGLIARAEKAAEKGPFKANPVDVLRRAYEEGLDEGGPGGGATVRAVYDLARDWDLDIDAIVDKHRKPSHHGALEDAQQRRIQADMVGRYVPEPPFARVGASPQATGTYGSRAKAFMPQQKNMLFAQKNKRPPWR